MLKVKDADIFFLKKLYETGSLFTVNSPFDASFGVYSLTKFKILINFVLYLTNVINGFLEQ